MSSGPDSTAAQIFADALDLPESARAAFLDQACGGDEALRHEVASLLTVQPMAEHAFGRPLLPLAPPASTELLGSMVGPYLLSARIAEGGMGTVYLGERVDREYEKKVAVKLIRPGAGTQEMLTRFRKERQVLASLEHPHIARLLDGGTTPDGAPYIVMEYIDGVAIDRFCDDRMLPLRERLALYLDVCGAVHFAHRHLVIHRDLKPGNILVDRSGRVKLLDFGISRVLEPSWSDPSALAPPTMFRAMTPRYASPEQLSGRSLTTSSDVYGLGVILYELLTGLSPRDLDGLSPGEVERLARETDPPDPSRRVAESPMVEKLARLRGLTPRKLVQGLRGDLDTIVLRALARDPERRYQGAEELAADLRFHLAGLPVRARRDTAIYRISSFARRHRALVASAAAVMVVLTAALLVTFAAYRRATERTLAAEHLLYTSCLGGAEAAILLDRPADAARNLNDAPVGKRGWEWRHLATRLDRSVLRFRPHRRGVTQVAWFSGSDRIVTASLDSSIALWKVDGTELRRWSGQSSGIESICIPPGESEIVAGLSDGAVRRFPLAPEQAPVELGRGNRWAMVAAAPSGRWLVAGFLDGRIKAWDRVTGAPLADWHAHKGLAIPGIAPTSEDLLTVGADGQLRFWDGRNFAPIRTVEAHARRIYSLATNQETGWIATGSLDRTARLWTAEGAPIAAFHGHTGTVAALAIEANRHRVVSAGADGRVQMWDGASGAHQANLRGAVSDVTALAASPDGRLLVAGGWGGEVSLWRSDTEDIRTIPAGGDGALVAVVESADLDLSGARIAYGTTDGRQVLREVGTGATRELSSGRRRAQVRFSPDGRSLLVAGAHGWLELLDPSTGTRLVRHEPDDRDTVGADVSLPLPAVAWTSDSQEIVIVSDGRVEIRTARTLEPVSAFAALPPGGEGKTTRLSSLAVSPDDRQFAIGGEDGSLRLWSRTGSLNLTLGGQTAAVRGLAFAPDGATLASVSDDGSLVVWNLRDGRRLGSAVRPGPRRAVVFTRDGTRILTAGADQVIRVHEADSARELLVLHGHAARINALALGQDGQLLLSAGSDGTLRLWDAPNAATLPSR
ncbi:MAG: serine/threonine protein kinase [Candidatus Eisenbacteria bacterium]|nr:serine/threonine protein kinase [Candidatus Eisenbacteria bacterium]